MLRTNFFIFYPVIPLIFIIEIATYVKTNRK